MQVDGEGWGVNVSGVDRTYSLRRLIAPLIKNISIQQPASERTFDELAI
ncbi:MAG: hypothetical protein WBA89_27825 [Microcoleus sp.]|nr:hypothetical protein [Tychonema sp. LEGE 07203]MBE9093271.1 hypothetical protein [Tychonema sp. LEGE 07203]